MSWLTTTSAAANPWSVFARWPASQSKMWLSVLPSLWSRIPGASGSSARRASTTAGSGSYSTSISSKASRAAYRSSATTNATSCPWNRTLSVASTAWVSADRVGIQARFSPARVSPVITARTLGCASAALVSMETIRACACGLRSTAPCSIPGSCTSSTYRPRPRMNRASSLRFIAPYPMGTSVAVFICSPPRSLRTCTPRKHPARSAFARGPRSSGRGFPLTVASYRGAALRCSPAAGSRSCRHLRGARRGVSVGVRGAPAGRLHDVLVAGAAADPAGDRLPDLGLGRVRAAVQQGSGGQHHARGAEAALQPVALHEALLHRVELPVARQALDGGHRMAVGHHREDGAGLHRHLVQPYHADPAVGGVAAPVRAGQPEPVAQEVHQQQPRLDVLGVLPPVHGHRDLHGQPSSPRIRPPPRRRARVVSSPAGCRL